MYERVLEQYCTISLVWRWLLSLAWLDFVSAGWLAKKRCRRPRLSASVNLYQMYTRLGGGK